MLHDYSFDDITEILKEEMNELKLFMRTQAVDHHSTTITRWFIKFHLEVHMTQLKEFFCKHVKTEVTFIPEFA